MKNQITKMKLELKELANQIREKKTHRKDRNSDGTPGCGSPIGLYELRIAYRHRHVAYCLIRGRLLEQCDSGYKLDMDQVNWIISSMKPDSKSKLYVVVNAKLSISQQAVQSGHAVAEFMRKHPYTQWSNGYLIYLKDEPVRWKGEEGNMKAYSYIKYGNQYAEFIEPDLDNKVTAYACFGPYVENHMKNKTLL